MAGKTAEKKVSYHLSEQGEFIIENYNFAKPMANFFPGIAGKYGIPMWVFYVNRGQAINSFGTDGKDAAILEFQPANKAWQQTSLLGFRTFIRCDGQKKDRFYEPFHDGFAALSFDITNRMAMTSYDLALEETNTTLGLTTKVKYFTIPQDNFAGLARIVTIENTSRSPRNLQVLDGLPRIVPFGIANLFLKKLSRTIEAWMRVENLALEIPFYKVNVDPIDRPYVIHVQGGNFYLSFRETEKKPEIIKPIVDPEHIFGQINDFSYPRKFLSVPHFTYPKQQQTQCKTPCGFSLMDMRLRPGQSQTFFTVVGNCRDIPLLNGSVAKKLTSPGYLHRKEAENKNLVELLQADVRTRSSSWEFDYYCKQTYLDNVMRGGYPMQFNRGKNPAVFYLYSRKHGDLERDYNKFQIQPTYFSQGNGNYRDMNQNRRMDVWFHPEIQDFNIVAFANLIQTDGYNPLVVKGATFSVSDMAALEKKLAGCVSAAALEKIKPLLSKPFTPGKVALFLEEQAIKPSEGTDAFLDAVFSCSRKNPEADHGEGFWTDHWHYNLDLLEAYLSVYPEKSAEILFEKRVCTFFDNWHVVQPRRAKYVLLDGKPKQLHSVVVDEEKKKLISARSERPHCVRTEYGTGAVYTTTLANKFFCLLANKLSCLDPYGVGVEMEADKPNWFDALNGLPALFGSSSCETFELKRFCLFLKNAVHAGRQQSVAVSEEIQGFLLSLCAAIEENLSSAALDKDFLFWDKASTLRENYRAQTRLGLSGREVELSRKDIDRILDAAVKKLDAGLSKARDGKNALYYGYFFHEVLDYEILDKEHIRPKRLLQKRVVPFLEAQMHALRLAAQPDEARAIYQATKNSELFDKKLKMYKVTAPLRGMPEELGRCLAFTPGWLENESIWLHMEYKYLLEVLKHGLCEEFYSDFKKALIPFQKAETYGRSVLENSSFIVSSAFPYKELQGNGFVARLSGSTVEFLQIWLLMNLGNTPFFLNRNNEVCLRLAPLLAGWLFCEKTRTYSFTLMGKIPVTYHNARRKNTYGADRAGVNRIVLVDHDGNRTEIAGDTIPSPLSLRVRSRDIRSIDAYLE